MIEKYQCDSNNARGGVPRLKKSLQGLLGRFFAHRSGSSPRCCFRPGAPRDEEGNDGPGNVSVASEEGVSSALSNKHATISPVRAEVPKPETSRASFCSLFRRRLRCCPKSNSNQKVYGPYDVVSVASDESIPSTFSNKYATISPARASCRKEQPDLESERHLKEESAALSMGRRASDSSSDDFDIGARSRGSVITTLACVHKVYHEVSDQEIVV